MPSGTGKCARNHATFVHAFVVCRSLALGNNNLSGTVPSTISALTALTYVV